MNPTHIPNSRSQPVSEGPRVGRPYLSVWLTFPRRKSRMLPMHLSVCFLSVLPCHSHLCAQYMSTSPHVLAGYPTCSIVPEHFSSRSRVS